MHPLILYDNKKNRVERSCLIISKNNSYPKVFKLKGRKLIKKWEIDIKQKNNTAKCFQTFKRKTNNIEIDDILIVGLEKSGTIILFDCSNGFAQLKNITQHGEYTYGQFGFHVVDH